MSPKEGVAYIHVDLVSHLAVQTGLLQPHPAEGAGSNEWDVTLVEMMCTTILGEKHETSLKQQQESRN